MATRDLAAWPPGRPSGSRQAAALRGRRLRRRSQAIAKVFDEGGAGLETCPRERSLEGLEGLRPERRIGSRQRRDLLDRTAWGGEAFWPQSPSPRRRADLLDRTPWGGTPCCRQHPSLGALGHRPQQFSYALFVVHLILTPRD